MASFDHIVVALAANGGDRSIIAYAALLARLGAARELRFVHVAESPDGVPAARERLRADTAGFDAGSAHVQCDVLQGSLTDRLLAYVTEHQSDLILIGAKKHKLGARLAMVAPCSVAVVPTTAPATLTHLMVAVDFSDATADTLQWATRLIATDPSIRCTALHVITHESADLFADDEGDAAQARAMRALLAKTHRHDVDIETRMATVTRTTEVGRNPFVGPASIQGADVAHTILEEAKACGADCIALSTRGRSRSAAILLGSVTEKVIERSPLPLLVGKHGGKNLGLASLLLGHAGWQSGFKTN